MSNRLQEVRERAEKGYPIGGGELLVQAKADITFLLDHISRLEKVLEASCSALEWAATHTDGNAQQFADVLAQIAAARSGE